MEIEIRLYATLRDKVGERRITVELSEPFNVKSLTEAVKSKYPIMSASVDSAVVAVNRAFAIMETPVKMGDEVAMFPPVSGGGDFPHPTYFALSENAPDLNEINQALVRPDVGAVITFTGAVRGSTQRDGMPEQTIHLEYESYTEMAIERMEQIAFEIWEKYPDVKGVAIIQRVGKLAVGECTTLVACAAGHRDQGAFEAARYGIDRLKEIVPVWKKEVGNGETVWVEGSYKPTTADNFN
ncbi:MAG: molybdopterin converting factor subunit 1 [Cellvibrionaceae bacterium]|jgi:molybdopterin converting factor subunit 1